MRTALLDEILVALRLAQEDLPALGEAAALKQGSQSALDKDALMPWCLEQLLLVQWVTSFCNRFKATLEDIETGTCTPAIVEVRANGRQVAQVFPGSGDSMKPNAAWTCELWMEKGKPATQGAMLQRKPRPDSAAVVLGAGNVGALGIVDCLHLLFQHNTVVLYKLHELRTYQESIVRKIFAPLIEKGFFETIEQGHLDDAKYLVSHPKLCHIHMTGATETHDMIVWGPREGRAERK